MLKDISDSLQPLELVYSKIFEITLYGSMYSKGKIFLEKSKLSVQELVLEKCPIQQVCDTLLWSGP